ncbi:hypothetical protein B0H19DRAFT_1076738 [Mycena capillaripes]|nr:hypothetical protein B0H19DRAFT_1076738 [Mycena capillaripes]
MPLLAANSALGHFAPAIHDTDSDKDAAPKSVVSKPKAKLLKSERPRVIPTHLESIEPLGADVNVESENDILPQALDDEEFIQRSAQQAKYNLEMLIVDIIQETYFATPKSLGHKFKWLFKSPVDDLLAELELLGSIPALVAANICGVLHNWKTGHFELYHKAMHDLHLKTSHSQVDNTIT